MRPEYPAERWRGSLGGLVGLTAGALALGPGLLPGYLLWYDMVLVPRLGLGNRVLGVDGSVPRAVPSDLVVALLSQLAPGWVVQKLLLLLVFAAVGSGVALLVRTRLAGLAAAVAACWNPFVAERLAIGHWAFLLGYAVLPWLAAAAARARAGDARGRVHLALWLVVLALTGSSLSLLGIPLVALVLLLPRPAAGFGGTAGIAGLTWLGANAPWLFPFLVLAPSRAADPAGVAAFAARSDTPLGLVPSLLLTGGIWNPASWPADRLRLPLALAALACLAAVLLLAARARPWRDGGATPGVLGAGLLSLVVVALGSLPGGRDVLTWVVLNVPGGGILRDSHKLLALWALALAVLAGVAAEQVRERAGAVRGSGAVRAPVVLVLALVLWPVATMPSMAWGGFGRWTSADYPRSYLEVARLIDAAPPGAVAVFPWTLYRRYEWNGGRVLLDPWQRLLDRRVVVNDDLPLSGGAIVGESPDAAAVSAALRSGQALAPVLRGIGVRYVLTLTDQPGLPGPSPRLGEATRLAALPGLELLDLGPVDPVRAAFETPRAVHAGAWRYLGLAGGALTLLVVAVCGVVIRRRGDVEHMATNGS